MKGRKTHQECEEIYEILQEKMMKTKNSKWDKDMDTNAKMHWDMRCEGLFYLILKALDSRPHLLK